MNPIDRFVLLVALPLVVAASFVEACVLARRARYDWRASAVSLLDLVLRVGLQLLLPLSLASPLLQWALRHRVATIDLDGPLAFGALFLGQELCYYAFHRASHRVRWFWCNHAVHHSPNELNLSAAYRIGAASKLVGSAAFYAPLVWLGFPPRVVFAVLTLNLLYQFWLHATWIPRLGWLEGIVNTPSAHRVHHATNVEYLDANYGGVLLVFDRLFGSYRPERADVPCRYGLVDPMPGHNPLRIELREWWRLAHDLARARSLRAFVGHLLMPPGWRPDGPGSTTAELRARAAAGQPSAAGG